MFEAAVLMTAATWSLRRSARNTYVRTQRRQPLRHVFRPLPRRELRSVEVEGPLPFGNPCPSIITDIGEGGPSRRHREYKDPYLPLAFTPLLSNFARRLYFARSQIIWFVAPVGVRITRSPAPNTYARTTSSPTCPGLTLALRW